MSIEPFSVVPPDLETAAGEIAGCSSDIGAQSVGHAGGDVATALPGSQSAPAVASVTGAIDQISQAIRVGFDATTGALRAAARDFVDTDVTTRSEITSSGGGL